MKPIWGGTNLNWSQFEVGPIGAHQLKVEPIDGRNKKGKPIESRRGYWRWNNLSAKRIYDKKNKNNWKQTQLKVETIEGNDSYKWNSRK